MDAEIVQPTNDSKIKPSNRRKSKSANDSKSKSSGKRSINLSLTVDDFERLTIHAMRQTNGNMSELVCRLIREHCRDFHIARTARSDSDSE